MIGFLTVIAWRCGGPGRRKLVESEVSWRRGRGGGGFRLRRELERQRLRRAVEGIAIQARLDGRRETIAPWRAAKKIEPKNHRLLSDCPR